MCECSVESLFEVLILTCEMLHSLMKVGGLGLMDVNLLFESALVPGQPVLVSVRLLQPCGQVGVLSVKVLCPASEVFGFLGAEVLQAALRLQFPLQPIKSGLLLAPVLRQFHSRPRQLVIQVQVVVDLFFQFCCQPLCLLRQKR